MKTHKFFKAILLGAGLTLSTVAISAPAYASGDPVYTPWHSDLAVGGYDAVSFFSGKPSQGDKAYFFEYKGAMWLFENQRNRNLFISEPTRFAPQYGGYCAWAVANDKLAKGDPEYWSLVDGKLYLNFNKRIKERWDKMQADFIIKADDNWPQILE